MPADRTSRLNVQSAVLSGATFVAIALLYRAGWTRDVDDAINAFFDSFKSAALEVIGQAAASVARAAPTFAIALVMSAALAWKRAGWAWCVPLFIGPTALIEFFAKLGLSRGLHLSELFAAARELLGSSFSAGASFPSGHVARSVFLAVVAARLGPAWSVLPLVLFAAVTFLARLYLEAHRLSDVVAGAALGVFAACAGLLLCALLDARAARRTLEPSTKDVPGTL